MFSEKTKSVLGLIAGTLAGLIGISLITIYILEAYVARIGDPDQSLLFWYAPFLLIGLLFLGIGLGLGTYGLHRLRQLKQDQP